MPRIGRSWSVLRPVLAVLLVGAAVGSAPPPEPAAVAVLPNVFAVVTNPGGHNLRRAPYRTAPVVRCLPNGTRLDVRGTTEIGSQDAARPHLPASSPVSGPWASASVPWRALGASSSTRVAHRRRWWPVVQPGRSAVMGARSHPEPLQPGTRPTARSPASCPSMPWPIPPTGLCDRAASPRLRPAVASRYRPSHVAKE